MKDLEELAKRLADEIHETTFVPMYVKWRYDDDLKARLPYVSRGDCNGSDIDYHYALDQMYDGPIYWDFESRAGRAFNKALNEHDEDCKTATYVLDLITDYQGILPANEPDELVHVRMNVQDTLVDWYEDAVDAAVDEANEIIAEIAYA